MTQLSITVQNADAVAAAIEKLGTGIADASKVRIYATAQSVVRVMKEYPPVPFMSNYVRTGRLGEGWQIISRNGGYAVKNNTPYTKYVVGNAYGLEQAWMHEGYWQRLRDVVDDEVSKLPEELINEINMVARRLGL
jgi:hypothetical protein